MNGATVVSLEIGVLRAVYEGPALGVGSHASGLACLIEPLAGTVDVAWRGGVVTGRRVLVPAGVRHEVRTAAPRVRFTYVAPGHVVSGDVHEVNRTAARGRPLDGRVLAMLRALARDRDLSAAALAEVVGLSPGRVRTLVRRELGVPMAMVRWWLRMRDVAEALGRGDDLTRAAHAAGFADSAHFSRTFRRMFGFAPSRLLEAELMVVVSDEA